MIVSPKSGRPRLTVSWAAKFLIHVGLLFVGFIIAYEARRALPLSWWMSESDAIRVIRWASLYALVGAVVEAIFQSERSSWRFASMREVLGLVRNVTITTGAFLGLIFIVDRGIQLPRSILPLAWLVSLALLVGCRMAWRLPHDPSLGAQLFPSWWRGRLSDRMPLLIIGPIAAANRQIRMLQGDPDRIYRPVGVVTPNSEEVGLRLHGVPVIGDVAGWARVHSGLVAKGARAHAILFLDEPIRAQGFSTEWIGDLRRAGHRLLRPQSLTDIAGAPSAAQRLQEIALEDFLPRKPVALRPDAIRALIAGRRVLVTGAGGSIGSEICRQLVRMGCSHLTMIDHSEFLLFEIDRELAEVRADGSRRAVLASVRDEARMLQVFEEEMPEVVFHAAALKHVGLVEMNPVEGVLTNVLGTWNTLRAAVTTGAAQFVLISTDKAVAPANVMGATKRVAEALLTFDWGHSTQLSAVRFGNVLGSAGSVVPIFRDQIARGGPVTVTHPEVNRYFMTIPEAVQLVLHSTAIKSTRRDDGPATFLLEMGDPVRISDLARQMIELSGNRVGLDIQIEYTGLKAGEKLTEILREEGDVVTSCDDGILEVTAALDLQLAEAHVRTLVDLARAGEGARLTAELFALVGRSRQADAAPIQ